ncbi:hypothetical protein [Streptomyces sp. NPDC059278]|uniref:hypothetical protein n=1 Tax=Streptomyces sp. NPDC059278 TaxID=3346801 RepID=UPI00368A4B48
MSAPMMPDRLAEILARAEAALPGPWCTDAWEIYQGTEFEAGAEWIGETARGVASAADLKQDRATASFVAAARTDVPDLVAAVRLLTAERDALRARIAELEAKQAAVLALHRKHTDSDHCFADDETWPCNTRTALGQTVPESPSPWERAVAGLNALVDAAVIFHVEPDGHISAPFSDEHIEWDLRARRWVLTHDDEDGAS